MGYANGNQNEQVSNNEESVKLPNIDDLLNAVMTLKQRRQKAEITSLILGMLSKEQIRRMENGEDISTIINELDSWKKDRIEEHREKLEALSFQQQRDFMFLRGGDLEETPLAERLVILQFLKRYKEEKPFTADELMSLAASFSGKEIKGGLFEEINHNPPAKGLMEDFSSLTGKAYQISKFNETLESANAQYLAQNQAAGTTATFAILGGAASAAIDNFLFGPANISREPITRLENIEQQGWDIKGSQSYKESPEAAGNPDGATGTGEGFKYFEDIQLKTEPNKAYFWSGLGETGADTAASIAQKNGGITLETIIEGQGIKMPKYDTKIPNSVVAWQNASEAHAKQVSGEVRAIVSPYSRSTSIWNTVELPALKANFNVTKIIVVDPVTLAETIIFSR